MKPLARGLNVFIAVLMLGMMLTPVVSADEQEMTPEAVVQSDAPADPAATQAGDEGMEADPAQAPPDEQLQESESPVEEDVAQAEETVTPSETVAVPSPAEASESGLTPEADAPSGSESHDVDEVAPTTEVTVAPARQRSAPQALPQTAPVMETQSKGGGGGGGGHTPITICHNNGNSGKYVVNTLDAEGVVNGHYGNHHQSGRDIIPPFTYNGITYSQNWDAAGQATWNNGCVVPPVPTTGTVTVTKVDQDGNRLSGATFALAGGGYAQSLTSGVSGVVTFNDVPLDKTLTLTETGVPVGCVGAAPQTVTLHTNNRSVSLTVENDCTPPEPEPGSITLTKVFEGTRPVTESACFAVEDASGTQIGAVQCLAPQQIVDGNLTLTFADLPVDTYRVVETQVPAGYTSDAPITDVVVAEKADTPVTITNTADPIRPGSVTVNKTFVGDREIVGNTCFSLNDGESIVAGPVCLGPDEIVDGATSVTFADVMPGHYTVVETASPDRYTGEEPKVVTVEEDAETTVNITNTADPYDPGSIVLTKNYVGDRPIAAACFAVLDAEETQIGAEQCLEADDLINGTGTITFAEIAVGDYTVIETSVPAGYTSSGSVDVTVEEGIAATATITNTADDIEPGSVTVNKTFVGDRPITGNTCFTLNNADGVVAGPKCIAPGEINQRAASVTFADVAPGDYTIAETSSPDRYTGDGPKPVVVTEGDDAAVAFVNRADPFAPGRVVMTVVFVGERPVTDRACFEVRNDAGKRVGAEQCLTPQQIADGELTLTFTDLPIGDYTVVETRVPAGYTSRGSVKATVKEAAATAVTITNVAEPAVPTPSPVTPKPVTPTPPPVTPTPVTPVKPRPIVPAPNTPTPAPAEPVVPVVPAPADPVDPVMPDTPVAPVDPVVPTEQDGTVMAATNPPGFVDGPVLGVSNLPASGTGAALDGRTSLPFILLLGAAALAATGIVINRHSRSPYRR